MAKSGRGGRRDTSAVVAGDGPGAGREDDVVGIAVVSVAWIVVGIGISVGVQGVPFGASPGEVVAPDPVETQYQLIVGSVAGFLLLATSFLSGERLSGLLRSND